MWTHDARLSVTAGSLSRTPEGPVDSLVSAELLQEASETAESSTCCPLDAPQGREIPHFDIMHFHDCMPKVAFSQAILPPRQFATKNLENKMHFTALPPHFNFQFSKFLALAFPPICFVSQRSLAI